MKAPQSSMTDVETAAWEAAVLGTDLVRDGEIAAGTFVGVHSADEGQIEVAEEALAVCTECGKSWYVQLRAELEAIEESR